MISGERLQDHWSSGLFFFLLFYLKFHDKIEASQTLFLTVFIISSPEPKAHR